MKICQKIRSLLRSFAPPQPPLPVPVEPARRLYGVGTDFSLNMTTEEKNELIREALRDDEGYRVLGSSLFAPLIEELDFSSLARQHLLPRYLHADEDVDEEPIVKLFVMDRERFEAAPERTASRLQKDVRALLLQDEDERFINGLRNAAGTAWPVQKFDGATLTELARVFDAALILVHRNHIADLIMDIKCPVDPVVQRELIQNGFIGTLNYELARVVTSSAFSAVEMDPSEVFFLKWPSEIGEFLIKDEYFVEPLKMRTGWRIVGKNKIRINSGAVLRACLA